MVLSSQADCTKVIKNIFIICLLTHFLEITFKLLNIIPIHNILNFIDILGEIKKMKLSEIFTHKF